MQAVKEKNIYVRGRGFDQTKIAPDPVLTNIIEDWPGMFGSTSDQVKGGKLFGDFVQYGYDTAPVTGASLQYGEGKAFNPNVPAAVVKQARRHGGAVQEGSLEDHAHRERRSQRERSAVTPRFPPREARSIQGRTGR